jgi:hypothetical protein
VRPPLGMPSDQPNSPALTNTSGTLLYQQSRSQSISIASKATSDDIGYQQETAILGFGTMVLGILVAPD